MTRAVQSLSAIFLGVLAAALAAISHAALAPIGLVVAVAGSFAVVRLVAVRTGWRPASLVAALAWFAVVLRASTEGFGGEILIWDSTMSTLFLVLGSFAVVIAVVLPIERKSLAIHE